MDSTRLPPGNLQQHHLNFGLRMPSNGLTVRDIQRLTVPGGSPFGGSANLDSLPGEMRGKGAQPNANKAQLKLGKQLQKKIS
jgi:hypothetical protein